ncbi:MAG TPA: LysR family transcriptional regulator substrate-binding protein, partial [Myxococcota bacterium]|nr:LysR family transcriptional regulator substrate-binding protein [Myxococcota bacterium]
IVMELRSIDAIQQMVREGIGAAFVSRWSLPDGQRGLKPGDLPLLRRLGLVWRADREPSPSARAFLAAMSSRPAER